MTHETRSKKKKMNHCKCERWNIVYLYRILHVYQIQCECVVNVNRDQYFSSFFFFVVGVVVVLAEHFIRFIFGRTLHSLCVLLLIHCWVICCVFRIVTNFIEKKINRKHKEYCRTSHGERRGGGVRRMRSISHEYHLRVNASLIFCVCKSVKGIRSGGRLRTIAWDGIF